MATITCKCDAVQIKFNSDRDLFRLECCCYDCSAALWYAGTRGGPAPPTNQCVDNSWLPNDFAIVRGADRIGAFLNFENADTTRFYCTNCWTILFGDHAAYAKRVVVTTANNYKEHTGLTDIALMSAQARHFLKDLSPDQMAALPPWSGDASHVYQGVSESLMSQFPDIQAAGGEGRQMNAQILLARIGEAFVPNGNSRLTSGPPTLVQQAT